MYNGFGGEDMKSIAFIDIEIEMNTGKILEYW